MAFATLLIASNSGHLTVSDQLTVIIVVWGHLETLYLYHTRKVYSKCKIRAHVPRSNLVALSCSISVIFSSKYNTDVD